MTTVYLVRHAEAEGNTYRRMHGHYNSLITQNGLRQIEALRARFAEIPIDACFASDLFRTCKTAQSVYLSKNLPLQPDRRFRELKIGRWEDTPFGWLEHFEKRNIDLFNNDEQNWHVEGSETLEECANRFLQGLDEVSAANDGKTIVIFTHSCALRAMQKRLLKLDDLALCENTAVSRLRWEDGAVTIELLNDASHLTPEISSAQRQKRLKQGSLDRADYSLWFEKASDAPETYLAMLRDKTVGRLVIGAGETKDTGVILDLELEAPHRGRRFGQQLLGQAVCTLRRRGVRRLLTTVPAQNTDALHFFRENGFVPKEHTTGGELLELDIEVRPLP